MWLQLSKNKRLVDEGLFYDLFSLQNATAGHTIVSGTISSYYGTDSVRLSSVTQHHETTETAMAAWSSITLYASWSFKNDAKILPVDPPRVAKNWTVDDSGGVNFTSIQTAINAAGPGDTIYVRAGTYVENVNVSKQISLVGEGVDVVTVRAADTSDHVFKVTADRVNISEFTATGATGFWKAGIYLGSEVDHCNIYGNNASNNIYHGIYLESSSNNNVLTHNIASSSYHGIYLESSSDNTITNNIASTNDDAIHLSSSTNNVLAHNIVNLNTAMASIWIFRATSTHLRITLWIRTTAMAYTYTLRTTTPSTTTTSSTTPTTTPTTMELTSGTPDQRATTGAITPAPTLTAMAWGTSPTQFRAA